MKRAWHLIACWRALALGGLLMLAACARSAPPPEPAPATPRAVELFMRGDWARAAAAFEEMAAEGTAEERAEATFFIALSSLARREDEKALGVLRRLQHEHPDSPWSRAASVVEREISHAALLRDEWMRAVIELDETADRVRTLEQQVLVLEAQAGPDQAALAASREERARLQAQIKRAEERLVALGERITELERELGELKQVDMQRDP